MILKSKLKKLIVSYCHGENRTLVGKIIDDKLEYFINNDKPINFIMPAFPGKSPNSNSTFTSDIGLEEIIALKTIENFISSINCLYQYGCKFTIIHDGHLFYDLGITRTDEQLTSYVKSFIKLKSDSIISFTLNDLMGSNSFSVSRNKFKKEYVESNINCPCSRDIQNETLFTKNEFADKIGYLNMSKNQLQKKSKEIAKKALILKAGLSDLISKNFDRYIRLSIHYQKKESPKMGIQLIPNAINHGTPWFNVLYKAPSGKVILGKKDWDIPSKQLINENEQGYLYEISESDLKSFEEGRFTSRIYYSNKLNR
ncbi:isocyanide synthase family protein [Shimazuella sp. AN120528]|uniref:L-tyrosine/L-tryptophan isonitrile synthase family protein n=1 Tax=Shimazuella soli TaxID=1892854 RepID=UPI001F0F0A50|nr:L-tyrosine/L-tryptophan isonitrile synthase family protein [Shimazuella soli]MCH5586359.1 isocyanide synthase family protein [Shimazuella soli]